MKETINIAVVGATGAVGKAMFDILASDLTHFTIEQLYPVASSRSKGKTVAFKGKQLEVLDVNDFDFSRVDIALFSAGAEVSQQFAPKAAEQGAIVIDNTSFFRYEADVPLIVPEVNIDELASYTKRNIIANPNCSTIQMLVALKPIYDAVGIERINIATYQAVSGSGQKAVSELIKQMGEMLNGRPPKSEVYPEPIAFNVLPHIDAFLENGYTKEEMKMVWETHKILGDETIQVNPTAVRVPVLYGHSEAIHIETKKKISAGEARHLLNQAQGIKVVDEPEQLNYPTPHKHIARDDYVYVGRIREDLSRDNGLNLWVVADNVRKGAALNAIQIANHLVKDFF